MRHGNSQRLPLDQAQESSTRGQDNNTRGFDLQPLQQEVRICCIVQRAHVPVPSVTGGCFFIFNLLVCLLSSAYVLCICSTIFFAGGELHNLCRGLQLSIGVFQPIKRQTPQCKLVRCNGDLLLGSDLICLRPLQEGFCKGKEPCQTHREVPQEVSFFCKQN